MHFLCLFFLIDPELIYKELCFSAILRNNPLNIISEYGFIRNNEGVEDLSGTMKINIGLLRRAFDNLYSNITKYAAKSEPVSIWYYRENNRIVLILKNTIVSGHDRIESTNIGINTCHRVMKMHGGSFDTEEKDSCYCVRLSLPVYDKS